MSRIPLEHTGLTAEALHNSPGLSDASADEVESTGAKLAREVNVLGGGALKGALDATGSVVKHPSAALDQLLISGCVGFGLAYAQRRAGALALGAEVISMALTAGTVKSTIEKGPSWLGQVKSLCTDTWRSGAHKEANKAQAAALLGQAGFDSALMIVGGGLGGKMARADYPRALPLARQAYDIPTTSPDIPMFSDVEHYRRNSAVAALYEARGGSVVEIERLTGAVGEKAQASHASGVVVDKPDLVATSYHVAVKSSRLTVKTTDGRIVPASMIAFDRDHDLALLRATEPLGKPVPVPRHAEVKSEAAILGYPNETRRLHVTTGNGQSIKAEPSYLVHEHQANQLSYVLSGQGAIDAPPMNLPAGTPEMVNMGVMTIPVIGGYSGSGVYRLADGKLLGVLARGGSHNVAVITPVERLHMLLRTLKQ